jgi:hypothetical protein
VAGVNGDLIDDYLTRLRAGLRTPPARTAEIVAEAEDHLRESAAAGRAAGLDEAAAQRTAVAAFGPVRQVIVAHRPTPAAYAAAAGMRAWPLIGCYLLLSALIGGLAIWREIAAFRGVVTPVTSHGATFLLPGRPDAVQPAAVLGGDVLAGLAVIAGFLVVRRRGRFGAALVPLPRGLFPLAAGIALLGLAVVVDHREHSHGFGWLPHVSGIYELTSGGGVAAAALLGACCVLRALVTLAEAALPPRQPAVAGRPSAGLFVPARPRARDRRIPVSAYAVEAGLQAGQWLGSFLLIAALIAGVLLYVEEDQGGGWFQWRYLPVWEAGCAGCGLAGALLFALVIRTGHRHQESRARVTLPRWLTLRATAALLVVIAVTEYRIVADNANGRLSGALAWHPAWQCLYWVVVGVQFAAMLMGVACVGRWILAGWRAAEKASLDTDRATR